MALYLFLSVALAQNPVPVWPRQFYFEFNETYPSTVTKGVFPGWMALDLDYNGGSESFYRSEGYFDHICSPTQPGYHGPCLQVSTGGWRYVIHPELNACCRCCSDASGCGALIEAWVDNAVFQGNQTINGRVCNHWMIQGNAQNNLMEAADSSQDICYLDNSSNDFYTVIPGTYKKGAPDPSLFAVPDGCTKNCPVGTPHCTQNFDEEDVSITRVDLGLQPKQEPSDRDRDRAANWHPRHEFKGESLSHASSVLNRHLSQMRGLTTKPCEDFSFDELDSVQRAIFARRSDELLSIYDSVSDPRRLVHEEEEHEQLWMAMKTLAEKNPEYKDILRDGRCREIVMWYVHHLTEGAKLQFKLSGLALPLLPTSESVLPEIDTTDASWVVEQYKARATCQQCHL